jgi:hypothetical protein
MHTTIRDLLSHFDTPVTEDAPCHVELDLVADIDFVKRASLEICPRIVMAMLIGQILQMAFTCLITDRTIQWMIEQ